VVDPAQGWIASWNNKPQATWPDAGDGTIWGTTQRAHQPMNLLSSSGRLSLAGVWGIARRTGELDLRATLGFKRFLLGLRGLAPLERKAVAQVAAWDGTAFFPDGSDGAGRVKGAGFPIMEAWFRALERRVGSAVFGPVITGSDTAAGVRAFTRTPGTTSPEFEFFDDYDQFMFDALSGRAHGAAYVASVPGVVRAALDDAIASLSAAQGPDPAKWRAPMPQISFQSLDIGSIGTIPWENRGTWGQAVAFTR
jgi:acyl-homoserine lactone acylase PvdQ